MVSIGSRLAAIGDVEVVVGEALKAGAFRGRESADLHRLNGYIRSKCGIAVVTLLAVIAGDSLRNLADRHRLHLSWREALHRLALQPREEWRVMRRHRVGGLGSLAWKNLLRINHLL